MEHQQNSSMRMIKNKYNMKQIKKIEKNVKHNLLSKCKPFIYLDKSCLIMMSLFSCKQLLKNYVYFKKKSP